MPQLSSIDSPTTGAVVWWKRGRGGRGHTPHETIQPHNQPFALCVLFGGVFNFSPTTTRNSCTTSKHASRAPTSNRPPLLPYRSMLPFLSFCCSLPYPHPTPELASITLSSPPPKSAVYHLFTGTVIEQQLSFTTSICYMRFTTYVYLLPHPGHCSELVVLLLFWRVWPVSWVQTGEGQQQGG